MRPPRLPDAASNCRPRRRPLPSMNACQVRLDPWHLCRVAVAESELQKTLSYPSLQCLMRKHDAGPQAAAGTVAERQLAAVRLHNGMGNS